MQTNPWGSTVWININQVRELARQYPDIVAEETEKVMDIIMLRMETTVVSKTPVGAGGQAGLRGSIYGATVKHGKQIKGVVGTPLEYGEVIEHGRRPGKMPPLRPIIYWASRKLGLTGIELRRAVRAIRWKIYQKGFAGSHMFDTTWRELQDWATGMLQTVPDRVARRLNA